MTYLDTHVVAWLFAGETSLLGASARDVLERDEDLLVSPMVVLELAFLREIGRIRPRPEDIMSYLSREIGLRICDLSFSRIVGSALNDTWTRDPFDRIIVAQASLNKAPLVTADRNMRRRYPICVW
jgi:PIN domain nuclease of toxin-antitoxin system